MRLELGLNLKLKQEMRLAPQIIQSIEILQRPAMDLRELVENELQENEVLEVREPVSERASGLATEPQHAPTDDNVHDDGLVHDAENVFERLNDLAGGSSRGRMSSGAAQEASDRKLEAMNNTADVGAGLTDHLRPPTRRTGSRRHRATRGPPRGRRSDHLQPEQRRSPVWHPRRSRSGASMCLCPCPRWKRASPSYSALDPRGVGARSIAECLLLQIKDSDPDAALRRTLLENHYEDIIRNKRPLIARAMGLDVQQVNELIQSLASLDPRPGAAFDTSPVRYIRPDVLVEWEEGRVPGQGRQRPTCRESGCGRDVSRMLEAARGDPKMRDYLKKKIESAKWLIDAITQRQSTLERVAKEIVARQTGYLDHGVSHLRPLKMQEVADTLSIHVSTVSRAISDKYAQTPRGIVPLKEFFTGGTVNDDGGVESRRSVKERVRQIIEEEDAQRPLSDDAVAEALKERFGLDIARRTVTKYRKALNIPSSRQRRVWS